MRILTCGVPVLLAITASAVSPQNRPTGREYVDGGTSADAGLGIHIGLGYLY